jgi:hypothetical protein
MQVVSAFYLPSLKPIAYVGIQVKVSGFVSQSPARTLEQGLTLRLYAI